MTNFRFNYTNPWLLLLLIPAVILTLIPHFKLVKKYRRTRNRIISIALHMLAMVLAINLLAGLTFTYETPNLDNEVILLVDVSSSNSEERDKKDEFVQTVINVADNEYKVGVVKFGYDQKYVAELSSDTVDVYMKYLESEDPDTSASDLAAALEYARTLFTHPDTAKIVVLSDGIETDGNASAIIKAIATEGIAVDTVYFPNEEHDELQIVSVKTPEQRIMIGEKFNVELTLRSNYASSEQVVTVRIYDNEQEAGSAEFVLEKQEMTVPVAVTVNGRGMHELRFEIENEGDTVSENNAYHAYVNLELFDNILLIERYEGESAKLQNILGQNYNLTSLSIENDLADMPRDIHELAEYEQVVLVNIAYKDMPAGFEEMLNEYVYSLGGGLFTVGGRNETVNGKPVPHAYNRADIEKSKFYKQMLPVNVIDYTPPIAVMIVVDSSSSMGTNGKLEAAIQGAVACLDVLNDRDFCGVMSFQDESSETLELIPVSERERILETIKGLGGENAASGGTVFSDPISRAGQSLSVIDNVARKHIIMVTDGEPADSYEDYLPYIEQNRDDGITMSIVTVDILAQYKSNMEKTAAAGGGKFYNVPRNQISTIPTVMQQDIALEAVAEINYDAEFIPTINALTTVVAGITQESIPYLTGYYGTLAKEEAVVSLIGEYVPIYAQWKYGEGNVGSFLSDLGDENHGFIDELVGQAIITNIIDGLFPIHDVRSDGIEYAIKTDNYTTQLNIHGVAEGNRIEVEVVPLTESVSALLDKGIPVTVAEENRRFTFEIRNAGLYEIRLRQYDEASVLLSEITLHKTFSYSEEYNEFTERNPIGQELLDLLSANGKGASLTDPAEVFSGFSKTVKREYDPRVIFLILAILFILVDIAVRKFKFKWPHELWREYKQRKADSSKKNG